MARHVRDATAAFCPSGGRPRVTSNLDVLGGITDLAAWKNPCAVATIFDMTDDMIGLPVIDGYQTEADDRILVRANTDETTNGIFFAQLGAWTPAIDFAFNSGVVQGTQVLVLNGQTFANVIFQVTTPNPIIVGADDITFAPLVPNNRPSSIVFRYVTAGAADTATPADEAIAWNSTSAAPKTETIPAANAVAAGTELIIKDAAPVALGAGPYPITITPQAGTIDGAASAILNSPGACRTIISDGVSNWLSIA